MTSQSRYHPLFLKGSLWSWSYGSWISNYLCSECLSLLMLWVRIRSWWGVLDATSCDEGCQSLATGRWFSLDTPVCFIDKTNSHDINEILPITTKVVSSKHLNTGSMIQSRLVVWFISTSTTGRIIPLGYWYGLCIHRRLGRLYPWGIDMAYV